MNAFTTSTASTGVSETVLDSRGVLFFLCGALLAFFHLKYFENCLHASLTLRRATLLLFQGRDGNT